MLKLRKNGARGGPRAPTIESFVQLAKRQNIDAIYKTFGDVPVQANGEMALKHYLATEVVPFFADADRLEGAWRVVGATFEDDSTGQIAYAYVVTKSGRAQAVHARLARRAQPRQADGRESRSLREGTPPGGAGRLRPLSRRALG